MPASSALYLRTPAEQAERSGRRGPGRGRWRPSACGWRCERPTVRAGRFGGGAAAGLHGTAGAGVPPQRGAAPGLRAAAHRVSGVLVAPFGSAAASARGRHGRCGSADASVSTPWSRERCAVRRIPHRAGTRVSAPRDRKQTRAGTHHDGGHRRLVGWLRLASPGTWGGGGREQRRSRRPEALEHYFNGRSLLEGWDVPASVTRADEEFARRLELSRTSRRRWRSCAQAGGRRYMRDQDDSGCWPRPREWSRRALEAESRVAGGPPRPGVVQLARGARPRRPPLRAGPGAGPGRRLPLPAHGPRLRRRWDAQGRPRRYYRRARRPAPAFWNNHNALGVFYCGQGRLVEARQSLQAGDRACNRKCDTGYMNLAAAHILAGEHEETRAAPGGRAAGSTPPRRRTTTWALSTTRRAVPEARREWKAAIDAGGRTPSSSRTWVTPSASWPPGGGPCRLREGGEGSAGAPGPVSRADARPAPGWPWRWPAWDGAGGASERRPPEAPATRPGLLLPGHRHACAGATKRPYRAQRPAVEGSVVRTSRRTRPRRLLAQPAVVEALKNWLDAFLDDHARVDAAFPVRSRTMIWYFQ